MPLFPEDILEGPEDKLPGMPDLPDAYTGPYEKPDIKSYFRPGGGGGGLIVGRQNNLSYNDIVRGITQSGFGYQTPQSQVTPQQVFSNPRYDHYDEKTNWEDIYGQNQSGLTQAFNGVVKGASLAATTILGGFGMLYGLAKAPFSGRLADIWDNEALRQLDNINKDLDNRLLPNYYTNAERNAAWYSTSNWFTPNFLFDKLVKNAGFAVGAIYSGNLANSFLRTTGTALSRRAASAAVAADASQSFKMFTPLLKNTARAFSAGKNKEAAAILEKEISSIADLTARTSRMAEINAQTLKFARLNDNFRRTAVAAYSSAGESTFESLQTSSEFRDNLIAKYREEHGGIDPSGEDLKKIDEMSESVGKASFFANLAILGVTEFAQLPYLLGSSYKNTRYAANAMLGKTDDVLLRESRYVSAETPTKFGKLTSKVSAIGRFAFDPKEAVQEASQFAVQVGTQNYFNKAYEGKDADLWTDAFLYGFFGRDERGEGRGAFVTKEGAESMVLGGITGGVLQGIGSYGRPSQRKITESNTQRFIELLNNAPTFKAAFQDRLDGVRRGTVLQQQEQDATIQGDELEARDLRHDLMHNYLAPRIKYGRFDMVMDDIADLRRQGSTTEGLAALKEEGMANMNDTVETYQQRLNVLETSAKYTNTLYDSLNMRYSGKVDEDGNKLYTPYVIDYMAYATSKIANYDLRIPLLNSRLVDAGVNTAEVLDSIIKNNKPNREATSKALEQINALNVSSAVKDDLKTALQDVIELSLRRKMFLEEFDDIKENPLNYQSLEPSLRITEMSQGTDVPVKQTVITEKAVGRGKNRKIVKKKEEVEKPLEVGKEYSLAEPIRKEGSVIQLAPKITVLSQTLGGELQVRTPNGKVTFLSPEQFKQYNISEEDNTSKEMEDTLDDSIDTVLNNKKYASVEKPVGNKLEFINSLDNQQLIDDVEKEFKKRVATIMAERAAAKQRLQQLLKNKEVVRKQQAEIELTSGSVGTGDPAADIASAEKESSLKDASILFPSTITESEGSETWEADPTASAPHVKRSRGFMNKAKLSRNRPNMRAILVTAKTQDSLGLKGLAQMSFGKPLDSNISDAELLKADFKNTYFKNQTDQDFKEKYALFMQNYKEGKEVGAHWVQLFDQVNLIENINDVNNGFIAAVFVVQEPDGLYFIDENGDKLNKVGEQVDMNKVIFQTMPTTSLVNSKGKPRYRSNQKEAAEKSASSWTIYRDQLFEYKEGTYPIFNFLISRGIPKDEDGGKKNHVGDVLVPEDRISTTPGLIKIPTTGTISHNGKAIKFPNGRPVLQFGDTLEFLNNTKLGREKAKVVFEVLRRFAEKIQKQSDAGAPIEFDKGYSVFLQNVLYWKTKEQTTAGNQMFVDVDTMQISVAGKKYDIATIAKSEDEIVENLSQAFHNTNNDTIKNSNKFYEYYIDKGTGKLEEREWSNYQTYLLSSKFPDGSARSIETTPLNTSVRKSTEARPYSFVQKYAALDVVLPVADVEKKPAAPAPAPTAPVTKIGDYVIDGKIEGTTITGGTVHTITRKAPFGDVQFTAAIDENGNVAVKTISNAAIDELSKPENRDKAKPYLDALESVGKYDVKEDTKQNILTFLSLNISATLEAQRKQEAPPVPAAAPTPTAPTPTAPVSTDAKTKVEKAQRQLDNVESGLNPNAKHPLFNVGQKYDVGYIVEVRDFKDERTDTTKDGVEVITKIYKPAIVDENGTMVSRAEVEVTIFDSYEQAEEFINAQYNKYKAIAEEKLAKAKTELAALESKPTDAKADIERRRQEEFKKQGFTLSPKSSSIENVPYRIEIDKSGEAIISNEENYPEGIGLKEWLDAQDIKSFDENLAGWKRELAYIQFQVIDKINAKYDAELADLEGVKPAEEQIKKVAKTQLRFAKVGDVLYDTRGNKYEVLSKKDKYGRSLEYRKNDKELGVINPKTVGPYENSFAIEDLYYEKPATPAEGGQIDTSNFKPPSEEDPYRRVGVTKETVERISPEEIEIFKAWAKDKVPTIPYEILENTVDTHDGEKAWGVFEEGVAKFYRGAARGTEYHEIFEGIWKAFLSPEQRQAILDEFKSKRGEFLDRASGKRIAYSEATDTQAKERIADDFGDFRVGKLPARSLGERVLRFFKAIVEFFKSFVRKPSLKRQLFEAIEAGKMREKTIPDYVRRDAPEYSRIPNMSESKANGFVQDMTARAAIYLFKGAKRLLYSPDKITGKEVFDYIRERYESENRLSEIGEASWEKLVKRTKESLYTLGINFNESDLVNINDDGKNSLDYSPEPFSVDWKKTSPFPIKFTLATLIKMKAMNQEGLTFLNTPTPEYSTSVTGYQLINFNRAFATLLDKLSNTSSIKKVVEKLFNLASSDSDYVSFVRRIGGDVNNKTIPFENFSVYDWRLFINMAQTFTKQKPEALIEYISGSEVYTAPANLYTAIKKTEAEWMSGLKAMSQDPKSLIQWNSTDKKYIVKTKDLLQMPIGNPQEMIDMLNKISVQFPIDVYMKLSTSQKNEFATAISSLRSYFGKNEGIMSIKGETLGVSGPMKTLAKLYVNVTNPNQESTYSSVDGKQTGAFTNNNVSSVFENEFNESENITELKSVRPELNDVFSANSVTLSKDGLFYDKSGNKIEGKLLKVTYVQGTKNEDTNKGTTQDKLGLAYRFTQEINQNVRGNYYILNPGDGSISWSMNIGNNITFEDVASGRAWKKIFKIFRGYLTDDISLALDWEKRSKTRNIGSKAKELRFFKEILSVTNEQGEETSEVLLEINRMIEENAPQEDIEMYVNENSDDINEAVKEFIESTIKKTRNILVNGTQVIALSENEFSYKGLDSNFAKKEGIDKFKMSNEMLDNVLTFVNANYVINNIEFHKILFGDPYQFKIKKENGKVILDELKRIKSFLSPRLTTFDTPEYNTFLNRDMNKAGEINLKPGDPGYHEHKDHVNTVTFEDVKIAGSLANAISVYDDVDVSDASSWLMDTTYREVKLKNGQWTDEGEAWHQWQMAYTRQNFPGYKYTNEALRKQDEEMISKPAPKYGLDVLKPIVTGNKYGKTNFDTVLDKFSQMPIYYSMVQGTNLEKLYTKMWKSGIGYAIVESGRKVGAEKLYKLYKPNGEFNDEPFNNLIQVPWKAYGIQVENSFESGKEQTRGSQITKLVSVDLFNNGEASPEALKEYQRNKRLLDLMHENAYNELLLKLGIEDLGENGFAMRDGKAISEALLFEMLRREMSENAKDSLETDEFGQFKIPFEASPSYVQIRNIMYSFIDKAIISPKMNGAPHVQVTSVGFEKLGKNRSLVRKVDGKFVKLSKEGYDALSDEEKASVFLTDDTLKFYTKDKPYCEIMLPHWFKIKMGVGRKFKTEEDLISHLNTPEGQKILTGVAFRIPTQALSSAEVFRVKGFLPEYMGYTVVVPAEITKKAGSDFDIDKLNMYLKSVYVDKNGDIRLVKYLGNEDATKDFYAKVFDEKLERTKINKAEILEAGQILIHGLDDPNNLVDKYSDLIDSIFEEYSNPSDFEAKTMSELEKLGDKDLQAALKEKFIKKMYKKSLENEYYDSMEKLLTLPEAFDRLITPVDDAGLSKEADQLDVLRGYDESVIPNRVLDRNYMTSLRHAFLIAKRWIGIVAVNITNHSQMQKVKTYIDPKRIAALPDGEKKFLGDGSIALPHNKITVDGEDVVAMSSTKTADGTNQLISNRLSGYGTATVDVVKDPFILKIIQSDLVVGTFMFLERIGAGVYVSKFMNQPIISEYLKLLDSLGTRNLFNKNNIDVAKSRFVTTDSLLADARIDVSLENLDRNIREYYTTNEGLSDTKNAQQHKILDEFLKYAKMAEYSFKFTQAMNYDTTKFRSGDTLYKKELRTQDAIASNIISSVENVMNATFVGYQAKLLDFYDSAMGDAVFKLDQDQFKVIVQDSVLKPFARNEYLPADEYEKVANKVRAAFLDYVIETKTTLGTRIEELLVNPKTSVAARLVAAREKYPQIQILQELVPVPSDRVGGATSLKLRTNDRTALSENLHIGMMRELRDANEELNQLYRDIVSVALLQGTYQSAISFKNIIPIEDYAEIVSPIVSQLVADESLDAFAEGSFQRTNFKDNSIMPVVQPKFFMASEFPEFVQVNQFGDFYADIYQYYSTLFPNIDEFGIKSTSRMVLLLNEKYNAGDVKNDFVKVPRVVTDRKTGDSIDMQTGLTITAMDYAIRKQKGDPSLKDFYGYMKVKDGLGNPLTYTNQDGDIVHVYKLVNLYGDGDRAVEHHTDFIASPLDNGTIKIDNEIPNSDLITYFSRKYPTKIDQPTPTLTGKIEFDKLPAKSITPTMTYAGIGSRETPPEILAQMTQVAKELEAKGYVLNTGITFGGKEEGADAAFSRGTTKKNLFAPEKAGKREIAIAKEIHPNPSALSQGAMKLMARNTNQVFGANLDSPVDFVLFYAEETKTIRPKGGTGQAVEMARRKDIPTINMADANWREQLDDVLSKKATAITREYTPENITSLKPNEIFVFGSNTEGIHGAGAALTAKQKFGAKQGQAEGLQGQSYAIITKDLAKGMRSIPLYGMDGDSIAEKVRDFVEFANSNPQLKFYVTKLGSKLAGYSVEEIKNIFDSVNKLYITQDIKDYIPNNVVLPKEYEVRVTEEIVEVAPEAGERMSIFEMRDQPLVYTTDQTNSLLDVQKMIDANKQAYYLLAGYAGTGKTTIAENIARYAMANGRPVIVLAPTNKAVKVLNDKLRASNVSTQASTIHRAVYGEPDPITGEWIPKANIKNAVVIVDESSMISKEVMQDLLNATTRNNIVIFMGDSFQLEPVGEDSGLFTGKVQEVTDKSELKEVRRQSLDSSILKIATLARTDNRAYVPSVSIENFKVASGRQEFINDFKAAIKNNENVAMIVATNKERMLMNNIARNEKFGPDKSILEEGETIISVANSIDFPNSEVFKINTLRNMEKHRLTFDFKDKTVSYDMYLTYFKDENNKIQLLMHFPELDRPSLYHAQILKAIRQSAPNLLEGLEGMGYIIATKKGYKLSPAVVIGTYGYSITAHKSQGSQWEKVFVNQDFVGSGWNGARWYYTAITRSSQDVEVLPTVNNTKISVDEINKKINQLSENEPVVVKTKPLFTIEKARQQKTFRNKPLEFVEKIPSQKETVVAMQNRDGKIFINEAGMRQKFEQKAWTKPAKQLDGSSATPLAEDQFKSFEEWFTFALIHEVKHDSIKKLEGETTGAYEDRINEAAIQDLEKNYKQAPEKEDPFTC